MAMSKPMNLASRLSQLPFRLPVVHDTVDTVVGVTGAICHSFCSIVACSLFIDNYAGVFGSRGPWVSTSNAVFQEPHKNSGLQLYNKYWLRSNPPRRPALRERSLTSPAIYGTEQQILDQVHSSLLQLPGEIRMMIYREVLGGKSVHITHFDRRLGHIKSTQQGGKEIDVKEFWRQECIEYQYWDETSEDMPTALDEGHHRESLQQPSRGFTSLIKTCRKVYIEAINILYAQNDFYTRQADSIVHLSQTVLPHRLDLITSLHIYRCFPSALYESPENRGQLAPYDEATWEETWRIIADMKGLRVLRVTLFEFWRLRSRRSQTTFLEPLKAVEQADVFEVEVPWAVGDDEGPIGLGDVPFRILEGETVEAFRRLHPGPYE
ncbi:hypothetical protein MMC18_007253 [Xylographa bjoerkii]|nr:hypothetical protein [Xylographa bjoerkii]